MKKRKWLSLLLAVMMLVSAVPFFPVTADAADGTVEVSTWAELKKALDYTTKCSVVKVVKDIETKSLNGHTGLHQDNIIFMTMAMDKVLDLNGHTVNAYAKYYSEVAQGYLINISHKDARLTIRDSVGGGALIGEFNQEFYYEFINVSKGTLVMESGTVKMLCPSNDNQYTKCAIGVSGTAIFNGGEVLTQVTSPRGEREERYLSRRLQAIRGEAGGSVTINGGTFDRVVLHSAPTPENRGKYELVVNGGFFRQSIALILTGDVYASNFDHLPMQINDAYFMRTTDKLDQCRLVLGGKMQSFYDNNWDYRLFYNDIPGATLDDAKTMMWGLVPHLISENGAVFTDVHDGNWYVRGNMRRSVENGGPTMAFQGTSLGIQGGIAKVISNAYGVKEVLLDGEPMACGERGFSAPQVDTTAESEHRVTFVMYPISPMLRVLGYSYSNDYSTGYIRMLVDDEIGYGMVHYPDVPESGKEPFSVTYYINESNVDTLTTMELQYDLMLETNGVKKQVTTGYKGAKVARWVDRTKAIDTIYLDISQPLVQGDYTSGAFTVDGSAPYTIEDRQGYWEHEDIWDLTGNGSVPAILGDQYYRFIRVYLKDGYEGYKFDKNSPPKVKIRGLNRECDSISVSVASDERSLGVSLASRPSELIQNAWGTVTGLRAGSLVDGVNIRPKDSYFDFEIKERPAFFHSFRPQWHGDDGTLREVLDGNAKGKCQRPGGGDLSRSGKVSGIDHAHCHTLRDVVQRYRQNHHGGALELAFWPFGLQTVLVQMWDEMVQQQQKQDTQPETHRRREKRQPAQIRGLLHSRDQQAPYRCRHHHSGGKAGEGALDSVTQRVFQKEHTARPKACAQKGDQNSPECVLYHVVPPYGYS